MKVYNEQEPQESVWVKVGMAYIYVCKTKRARSSEDVVEKVEHWCSESGIAVTGWRRRVVSLDVFRDMQTLRANAQSARAHRGACEGEVSCARCVAVTSVRL